MVGIGVGWFCVRVSGISGFLGGSLLCGLI